MATSPNLKRVEWLRLRHSRFSNKAVQLLGTFTWLKRLSFHQSNFPTSGLAYLQSRLGDVLEMVQE